VRDLFLLDRETIFLNHGSCGACPKEVLEAQHAWQREMERNPVEFLARRSAALLREARTRLGEYVGARAEDLVFLSNATTGVTAPPVVTVEGKASPQTAPARLTARWPG
jgi:isopenicillin-N epimerase